MLYQCAIVSTNCLDSFAIHLVVFVRSSEVETGVSLLVDQQVRMVNFLELELDRLDELLGHVRGGLLSEFHGFGDCLNAEFDHDGVSVTVNDLGIELVSVIDGVPLLHFVFGEFNHFTSEGCDALRDLKTGQFADLCASETVDGVSTDLQSQLSTIKNLK